MNSLRISLLTVVTLILVACGSDTGQPGSQNTRDAAQLAQERDTAAEAGRAALEAVEESVGESAAQTEPEETIVLAEVKTASPDAASVAWKYGPDKHFLKLTTAQGTSSPPDRIEVAEVFWYGCPHCYNFDPYINKWEARLPDDVNFVRLPVIWNPTNQIHARAFYTAESLGKLDEMHEAIFREIHINKKTLSTEADIQIFFERYDVSQEEFESTFRSFAVESKLKRAKNLTQRYRIQSVPLLVTNGKYLTQGTEIKNFDDMLAVTEELVERERQEL
jgi:thiol:disulfide interchange protein DsbA